METRPDRFTAFVDANVLYAVLRRDIILSLAETGAFRVRWSVRVLDEPERALARRGPPMTPERAARHRAAMERAFGDACVEGFEPLVESFSACPDPNDAHVIAAAVHCRASVIVTENLKHFPAALLQPLGLEAVGSDDFIADAIDLDQDRAVAAMARMRARYRAPALTAVELLQKMRSQQPPLEQTAALLEPCAAAW